jgi:hypothetical protein
MSENIKEIETKQSFLFQPQERQELKLETILTPNFGEDSENGLDGLGAEEFLSRRKESGARIRTRLSSGRGVF